MAPAARCLLSLRASSTTTATPRCLRLTTRRAIHSNPAQPAKVVPVYGTGPPPEPPQPSAEYAADERIARRKRQAEILRLAGDIRKQGGGSGKSTGLKKRFWRDVTVREVDGALEIHLDTRPLRHPTNKTIIRLPTSKPLLAHALALEWDQLTSASQATKQHLIPLTSLVCRALDIAGDAGATRGTIAETLLRYLDTDSLLCWSPPPADHDHGPEGEGEEGPTLRQLQEQAAAETIGPLTRRLWPGVTIRPALDSTSILPRRQDPNTREVIQGWVLSLTPFELAALERATLAGKSLLAAARLITTWSEDHGGLSASEEGETKRFGVEEAARAVSLEVAWQTGKWGEVEDTHDVEKEDLRRQLGSAVLLVSGTGKGTAGRGNGSKL
ncbi:Protein atp12, mitochondrial [Madurella mycetomatis]|uniref:Protein atp12, mitochondrial n=1 Tax=Madurella mycetomatis TaxID=100816 RepID=A0A175VP37_9PEZI|nr:Protein atp12, mitochondrial [Madurella mycetomatis]